MIRIVLIVIMVFFGLAIYAQEVPEKDRFFEHEIDGKTYICGSIDALLQLYEIIQKQDKQLQRKDEECQKLINVVQQKERDICKVEVEGEQKRCFVYLKNGNVSSEQSIWNNGAFMFFLGGLTVGGMSIGIYEVTK